MAYVIKSGKSESEKALFFRCFNCFFKKSGLFLQMSCKIFQNEHDKAIQMKKRCTFFYVMAYVIKSGKSESEKATC